MNESYLFHDRYYCTECITTITKNKSLSEGEIVQGLDPTICLNCNLDNGSKALETIAGFPTCKRCSELFVNRPFPPWIKSFALTILFIVIFGSLFNFKYFSAYLKIREAQNELFINGNYEKAYISMKSASQKLNHLEHLKVITGLYEGLDLFHKNKIDQAFPLLNAYKEYYPDDNYFDYFIFQTNRIKAFDDGDYKTFYALSIKIYDLWPSDTSSILGIASGSACMYALSNDIAYKKKSLEYINLALGKIKDENNKEVVDFTLKHIDRLKHRLYSKQIINPEDFYKKFPQGWGGEIE